MKLSEKQWHERIYLQEDTDGEATWCQDKINDDDCEYIRADKYALLEAKLTAIPCGSCDKNLLECKCDDLEDG